MKADWDNQRLLHLPDLLKIVSGKDCNLRLYPKLTDDESFVNCQTRNFIFTNQSWDPGNQTSPVCHIPEIIWTIYLRKLFEYFYESMLNVECWTTVGTIKMQQPEKTDTEKGSVLKTGVNRWVLLSQYDPNPYQEHKILKLSLSLSYLL